MNYTEVEARVREATNEEAWGPTGRQMQEIAQYTFTYEHYPEVMAMLWRRMLYDNKTSWRRVYKVDFFTFYDVYLVPTTATELSNVNQHKCSFLYILIMLLLYI